MGSDQTAAEALQEAETEVGVTGTVDQGRPAGPPMIIKTVIDFGLTA